MDISVGATVNANPEVNIGKLLQMIEAAGSDHSTAKEKNANGVGNDTETGNNFFQILKQKITQLLQTGQSESSQELTATEDLSVALEELLQDDQTGAGEVLSEFALLMMAAKLSTLNAGENDISGEVSSTSSIGETDLGGILKQGLTAKMNNTEQTIDKLPEKGKAISANQSEDLLSMVAIVESLLAEVKEKVVTESNTNAGKTGLQNNGTNTLLQDGMDNSSAKQSEDLLNKIANVESLLSEVKEKVITELNTNANKIVTQNNSVNTLLQDKLANSSVKQSEDLLNKIANVESHLTAVKEKVVAELSTNAGNIEAQNNGAKKIVQEMEARTLTGYEDVQREASAEVEEKASLLRNIVQNYQDQTGQDVKNKMSDKQEMLLTGKQENALINDAQKNMAGKVAAFPDEIVAMIDKIKTEAKGKTLTVEKNIESNALNASNVSGISTAKTAASEISPSQIISRVAAEFNENLANEGGRVKITLTPPTLGTLDMDVIVRNGTVKVMLIADNKDVQQMLSGNLDSLKGSLQSQGLTIERCDVMMQDRREQYSQGFNQQAFNQEQSAKHHYDEGEGYNQDTMTVTPLKIRPMNQSTQSLGNISLFA